MVVSRLRVFECDGLDGEVAAEIESGGIERQSADDGPEVELIAGSLAVEAAEETVRDVNREAAILL